MEQLQNHHLDLIPVCDAGNESHQRGLAQSVSSNLIGSPHCMGICKIFTIETIHRRQSFWNLESHISKWNRKLPSLMRY